MRLIYLLGFFILTHSCSNQNTTNDVEFEVGISVLKNKYTIVKEEASKTLNKSNIEVNLIEKVDKKTLNNIANEIRRTRSEYASLYIYYYVFGMKSNSMAWATTHFTPSLEIKILGSTKQEDIATSSTNKIEGEIIGKWRSEQSLMGASIIIFKDSIDQLKIKTTFKNGSEMNDKISKSSQNGKIKFTETSNTKGEYFILESNGNLGMYDSQGKFDEAILIMD